MATELPLDDDGKSDVYFWMKHVRYDEADAYLKAGWAVAEERRPVHHHAYGFLMHWIGVGEPPKPEKDAK